jgi:hypothetical protein
MPYDEFLDKLRRDELPPHSSCPGCSLGSGVMEDNLHMLVFMCPEIWQIQLRQKIDRVREMSRLACRHGVQKLLKIRTGLLKMGGDRISPTWRIECYWELGYGFLPYKPTEDLIPEVQSWLCQPMDLGGPMGRDNYLLLIEDEVSRFMTEEWKKPTTIPSIQEWVKTCKWLEGKSGSERTTDIMVDGKRVRTGRMKSVMGVYWSNLDAARDLVTPCRETMQVLQKSEGGKIRPVAKTGNSVNRKMNYLSEVLERGLHGSRLSTLFAGEAGNEKIDYDLIEAARDRRTWKVPLDQGGFDQHQSKAVIAVTLYTIGRHLVSHVPEIEPVWAALWDSLFVHGACVSAGDWKEEWRNGLPSGWRWTAVLDTILNVTSFRAIWRIVNARLGYSPCEVSNFYAQGDDVIFSHPDLAVIQMIIDTFGQLGYEVHPLKTYIYTLKYSDTTYIYKDIKCSID